MRESTRKPTHFLTANMAPVFALASSEAPWGSCGPVHGCSGRRQQVPGRTLTANRTDFSLSCEAQQLLTSMTRTCARSGLG